MISLIKINRLSIKRELKKVAIDQKKEVLIKASGKKLLIAEEETHEF